MKSGIMALISGTGSRMVTVFSGAARFALPDLIDGVVRIGQAQLELGDDVLAAALAQGLGGCCLHHPALVVGAGLRTCRDRGRTASFV